MTNWPWVLVPPINFLALYVHVDDVTFVLSDAPPGMDKEKKVEEGNKEGEDKKPKEEEEDKTKEDKEGDEAPKKTEGDEENDKKEEKEGDEEKKPRPLHKVTSIFLR